MNITKREFIISSIFFLVSTNNANLLTSAQTVHSKYIKLKHEALHSMDGKPSMMDADAINDIINVLKKLKKVIYGESFKVEEPHDIPKEFGHYEFKNKLYSLTEIAEIEKVAISKSNHQDIDDLHKILVKAKSHFHAITDPFEQSIKAVVVKNFITKLIEESCRERKRNDSFLLSWSKQNGTDRTAFDREMKDLQALSIFCTDLANFLGDLLHSCPKGISQFRAKYQGVPEKPKI